MVKHRHLSKIEMEQVRESGESLQRVLAAMQECKWCSRHMYFKVFPESKKKRQKKRDK
jgi:hypothetical protein